MSKPTVAIFVYCLRGGGAERVCANLANALLAMEYQVTLVTELVPATDQYALSPRAGRVVIGEAGKGGGVAMAAWRMVRKTARLRAFLKREKPDVLISFMTRSNAMALTASIGLRSRIIISERNDSRYRPEPLLDRTARALLYRRSDLLVAQTPTLEDVSRTHFRVARTACIPNPFVPALLAKAETARGAEIVRPYALAMGRLHHQKGFDVLIRAFARSAGRHLLDLVIAGEGAEREPLCTLARELRIADRVRFVGHVEQPSSLLAGCEMFVLSSRYEGFPNVLLEAMSFDRPVISTLLPSGAHAIIDEGVSGLLVPPDDVGSLADAIARLATDGALSARLSANAQKAIEPFGLEPVIAQWREAIEKVAA